MPIRSEPLDRLLVMQGSSPLAYDVHGSSGPTVVLLHGIPGSRGTFAAVGEKLGRSCRVVVPDLLGFGESPDAPAGHHAAEHAEVVAKLIDQLGVERFHLVGFDFGGPTAMHLAGRLRERVRSLTVAATNLFPDTPIPPPLRLAKVPLLGWLFFRLAFGTLGLMAMWLAAVADRVAFPFARYRESLRGQGVRTTRDIFLHSMRDLPGLYGEVERIARSLGIPALVLWGDRDPFFPISVGERTAQALGAELRVLAGCGHFVPEERADEMVEGVSKLIARAEERS